MTANNSKNDSGEELSDRTETLMVSMLASRTVCVLEDAHHRAIQLERGAEDGDQSVQDLTDLLDDASNDLAALYRLADEYDL